MNEINIAFNSLSKYIESENYRGYDPYDTLLSWFPFHWIGKWGPIIATQLQKRNPVNVRPILGIRKSYNPKAMGLFLQAFSILYVKTKNEEYKETADFLYEWLKKNYSKGYSGYCWGYNFPWANPIKYLEAFVPSAVVTGFVNNGLWQYYKMSHKKEALDIINSASEFVLKDLPSYEDNTGVCISYTPLMKDICYNASLLAGGILATCYKFSKDEHYKQKCLDIVNFVIERQKENGSWNYSLDIKTGIERVQIDFHQGYILESIFEIKNLLGYSSEIWETALSKGLNFYYKHQFYPTGRSVWRYPKKYPIEIHNQSQGIITFAKLEKYHPNYREFAFTIADWTIKNMQNRKGYFYYHKNRFIDNKLSYMRWSQAWMFLALSHLID